MRSALLCVFFTLIILRRIRAQNDGFRPTPIPLSEWQHDRREGRAGTLHETFRTTAPPAVAAIPAHYWEDALRHSVYLTLVRDKIDQLIAKGEVLSPDGKPGYDSKEIDDHDLWDKIKTAPFDRIQQEEPGVFGDVTIMAKGRLLEDKGGFRFAEDERSKEKCSDEDCMRDVKAFWSVKRVRQRDMETSPGKYHYELTFSVISQTPKKQRKPYENPIRTFTVKESSPSSVLNKPQEYRHFGPPQTPRPERSIWFHKNISPAKQTGRKHYFHGLDRIFSSFFSDDDEEDERAFDSPPPKYKQGPYAAPLPAYSKIGHTGVSAEQHQQVPYPYRPHPLKHIRPPLQAPPIHPFNHQYNLDQGVITASNNNPYAPYPHDYSASYPHDHRVEPSQAVKTTRPAVLPTPLPHQAQSIEVTNVMSAESAENTSLTPNTIMMHKTYNKYRTTPAKVNHFPDHVRPPIYNAPPGVFVTMDKKPFKPMPPLKLMHSTRPHRPNRPIDFRPSPQITDIQSTDSFDDTAFRPITMNFGDTSAPGNFEVIETTKKGEQNKTRKPTATGKKPTKKHEKPQRTSTTTATSDIITAQPTSEEESETIDWVNILGAFTKTTPMLSQTEKMHVSDATTPMSISTAVPDAARPKSSTTTEAQQESTSATTVKPKRTRPPPKYSKQDKIKKHKRLSTTTTTTTTTTDTPLTTIKKYTRPSPDLTPQASAATVPKPTKPREPQNKTQTTTTFTSTTTTTTTPKTTTSRTTTTTTQSPITTKSTVSTTQSRSKSRFRQSALIFRGTSIKHDKWNGVQYNQTTTPSSVSYNRRKGSNFHGYVAASAPRRNIEDKERNHEDRKPVSESISERTTSQSNYEDTIEHYETNSVIPLEQSVKASDEDNEDVSKDHSEFIFQPTTTLGSTEEAHTPASNKTKCKKKKTNISTTHEPNDSSTETFGTTPKPYTVTTYRIPTEAPTTGDIFEEFLNFNFNEDDDKDPGTSNSRADLQKQESSNQESYLKIDNFEEFLDMHLSEKKKLPDEDQYGNDDDEDDEDSENDDDDEEFESKFPSIVDDRESPSEEDGKPESVKNSNGNSSKRPYTLLELMAMA